MTTICNIWMICLELNRFFYDPSWMSWMLNLSEFVWALRSSVLVVDNNFLLIDAIDRSKISRDQKRFFIALSLYPLSFFANTPFNLDISKYRTLWNLKIKTLFYYPCRSVWSLRDIIIHVGVYDHYGILLSM